LKSSQELIEDFKKGFFAEYDSTEMCSVLADKRHIFTYEMMPAVFYNMSVPQKRLIRMAENF